MTYHFKSFDDINFPKDENGNYIISDPDMFDATYDTEVIDRSHSNGTKIIKPRQVIKQFMTYSFYCKKCGKFQTRSFRKPNIENHKTLLCQPCLNIELYGAAGTFGRKDIQEDIKKIFMDKYGVDSPLKSQEVRNKINNSNLANFGNKSTLHDGGATEAKVTAIFQERYGVNHPLENHEIYAKTQESLMKNKGVTSPLKDPDTLKKAEETTMKNHGVRNIFMKPGFHEESDAKKLERYGSKNNINKIKQTVSAFSEEKKAEIQQKRIATNISIYGYESYFGSQAWKKHILDKFGSFNFNHRYDYYNIQFDSSWELAVWIYCIDHNIPIIRNVFTHFTYEDAINNKHDYYPDFMINGKLVEIKGDQYFNPDGTMGYPYTKLHHDSDELTPEEKSFLNDLYERKHQCGLANGVEFWRGETCQKYIEYCNLAHPNWQTLFRKDNIMNPTYWCFNIVTPGIRCPQFYIPINTNAPVTPFDKSEDGYVFANSKAITPYDIK